MNTALKNKNLQKVTFIKHWTENLFSFRIQRPASFKFRSGEFVMIGLPNQDGKPILRAYSIASPSWSEELEFYSIIVEDGPLTSRLKNIIVNDEIILMPKPTGTLVLDALKPGKRLFLLSSGTGFAPFSSLIREPETFEKFDRLSPRSFLELNVDITAARTDQCRIELLFMIGGHEEKPTLL